MPWRQQGGPTKTERIVAGISYLSLGMVGLVYILFAKRDIKSTQFKFHAYQSIFLALLWMVAGAGISPLGGLLSQIASLASRDLAAAIAMGFGFLGMGVSLAYFCAIIYGAVMAFLGKFTQIPFVSDLIHRNMPA